MASLRILTGSLENEEIELTPDPMTVGRSSACNIRIADAGVSSKHAKIWCEDGQYFLMDLGSTNGTFVNDKDVDREQLNDGDVITFGMTKAAFVGEKPKPKVLFEAGETIWTESSYKYEPGGVVAMLERAGFERVDQWIDRSARFAITLVRAV